MGNCCSSDPQLERRGIAELREESLYSYHSSDDSTESDDDSIGQKEEDSQFVSIKYKNGDFYYG